VSGPENDDWFGDSPESGPAGSDDPSSESAWQPDDWLNESDSPRARTTSWARGIDRRVVVVALSLVVLLIAGLAAGGVFSGSSSPSAVTQTTSTQATNPATTATTAPASQGPPAPTSTLKPGDTGDQVSALQRALASLGFSPGKVDGVYGPGTKSAVEQFQRSVKSPPTGRRAGCRHPPRPGGQQGAAVLEALTKRHEARQCPGGKDARERR
jgi:hypothetical protein